jgi:hypothetical protein
MKTKLTLIITALCFAFAIKAQKPGVVVSDKPGWHKIGEVTASFKMDNEAISAIGADMFKSIKLKVMEAPVNIESLKVYYEDNDIEDIPVRSELKEGAETRVINIKNKDIKKVSFVYKTLPNSGKDKARVELWGMK